MITDTVVEIIPVIIKYDLVKDKEETFLSMTSLTVSEFDDLRENFEKTLNDRKSKDGGISNNNGGRPSVLNLPQDKLFFILFYLKNYPLQETIGFIFGLSQSRANYWIHFLSGVLKETLETMDLMPKHAPLELLAKLESEGKQDFSVDGTERPINRPKNKEKQKKNYSGRKKTHTVKNIIIVGNDDREIKYLSDTVEGSKHDKKVIDESEVVLPEGSTLFQDTGFQGYNLEGINILQPKKKLKGKELTSEEKESNKLISRVRVVVENVLSGVKRLHIVQSVFRNTKENYDDLVMWLACGLHNFRTYNRIHSY